MRGPADDVMHKLKRTLKKFQEYEVAAGAAYLELKEDSRELEDANDTETRPFEWELVGPQGKDLNYVVNNMARDIGNSGLWQDDIVCPVVLGNHSESRRNESDEEDDGDTLDNNDPDLRRLYDDSLIACELDQRGPCSPLRLGDRVTGLSSTRGPGKAVKEWFQTLGEGDFVLWSRS